MLTRRLATLGVAAICALALWSAPAMAATPGADFAQLTMSSEPGAVGGGLDYSYSTPSLVFYGQSDGNSVHIYAHSPDYGDTWTLDFGAPEGELLVPGTYSGAERWVRHDPAKPGLDVSGNGLGCGPLQGTFTVLEAEYGPNDTIQRFRATFEQRCLDFPNTPGPALRGEVQLVNHAWRPPLEVSLSVDSVGSRRGGMAIVHGTLTCNVPGTTVSLYVSVAQDDGHRRPSFGDSWQDPAECGPNGLPWSTTIESLYYEWHGAQERVAQANPFLPGEVQVQGFFAADDGTYGFHLEPSFDATVDLGP